MTEMSEQADNARKESLDWSLISVDSLHFEEWTHLFRIGASQVKSLSIVIFRPAEVTWFHNFKLMVPMQT